MLEKVSSAWPPTNASAVASFSTRVFVLVNSGGMGLGGLERRGSRRSEGHGHAVGPAFTGGR